MVALLLNFNILTPSEFKITTQTQLVISEMNFVKIVFDSIPHYNNILNLQSIFGLVIPAQFQSVVGPSPFKNSAEPTEQRKPAGDLYLIYQCDPTLFFSPPYLLNR